VQFVEVRVLVDHAFDELNQVVLIAQRGFHLGLGCVLLEVLAEFLAFT